MKHTLTATTCCAALVASLAACGGSDKAAISNTTASSSPSTTATSQPTTPPPTATTAGPTALALQSTYDYGGLTLVVNLPADIPGASLPSMRLFSEFLQADGRTTARNKLDPSLTMLASADVVKGTQSSITPGSVQAIGSVTYTINDVLSGGPGYTRVAGCLDQSKLVQVRRDGSHFVDAATKKHPSLKMTADINRGTGSPKVTRFTFAEGTC